MNKELPIKLQTILYRREDSGLKILILKRCLEDGGFWQTVTGTLEINESILDSRKRELLEEARISDAVYDEEEITRFSWNKKDWTVAELVYSAETKTKDIALSNEHTEFKWVDINEAIEIVEKQNTKDCLNIFKQKMNL